MTAPYDLTGPIGARAVLGIIVLQTDETLEPDFHRIFAPRDIAVYASRVPSGDEVTQGTLAAMADELPRATTLFPRALRFSTIGYGCTSGATVIGPKRVKALVKASARVAEVTNPLSAVLAGLRAVGAARIGLVSPYIASVTAPLINALGQGGIVTAQSVSFDEVEDAKVARIDPKSIHAAAMEAGVRDVDAVVLSCTNLRTLDVIENLEARLNKPVISSNQALAWHMARLAKVPEALGPGRLWTV